MHWKENDQEIRELGISITYLAIGLYSISFLEAMIKRVSLHYISDLQYPRTLIIKMSPRLISN